ncbi:MAG TPA: DUF899 domain-containing protein [Baekduia sp.]|nr:DUF899 domain-containing protein [Baekduia sp.]
MHRTATRDEWRTARLALLQREKELTRLGDELARQRQDLPWVPVDKEYVFDTPDGPATLADLFGGRSQLIVQHFMLGPDMEAGCASCSSIADGVNGPHVHLEHHDVAFVAVSRAPLERLEDFRERMGWSFRWVSSHDSDFNFDFGVSSTAERPLREYNFAPVADGMVGERPGMSAFALQDGTVFHTYSTYGPGVDAIWGVYAWLDRAPKGRNEDGPWHRRRDEYVRATA